ncbi:HEAT repeat domain-containing protein [Lysobacter sp. BMK333-48F3]|uniref:HEAT repeat domain-containing protein n=1 Tax=Lysobacter sp. BMK333-48F3 TaxID=2867962 RepID=UPI001C8C2F15|nr:HEAT repeat domain-containing protein [Lysobacter sp. BMK333-48F3]MBX9401549.1 HEAT repeat domain-containing protein [Lysobacter sp. BMK333-48F3]
MKPASVVLIALASAALGAVLGGAYVARRDGAAAPATPDTAAAAASRATTPAHDASAALPDYVSIGSERVSFEALRRRAASDPAFLRGLMQRYRDQTEPVARGELLALLNAVSGEEVLRFALSLTASTRAEDERDGLALLAAYPMDRAEVRDTLLAKLGQGGDPQRMGELVAMLTPATMASEDAAPVIAELATLARHPDPALRAQAVLQLAQWDDGEQAEDLLHRAILDSSAEVRAKAIAGIQGSHIRSDRLKEALLAIAADPASSAADRGAATFALQQFRLNRAEYGIWRRAQAQADADSGEGG